jgi:hypothetical protein
MEIGIWFKSQADARELHKTNPRELMITFVPTDDEDRMWKRRERYRFHDGIYHHVPWSAYEYHHPDHYAHLSVKNPGYIAYTKNAEHGVNDRQTMVRPGKYLQEFYADVFTPKQIADYVAACSADRFALKIATTAGDIEAVYTNGPNSCMSHHEGDYSSPCHPVRVYGDSDLAVAYYGDIASKVSARCIVWPDQRTYLQDGGYGDWSVLERLLRADGWQAGSIHGAHVRYIAHGDTCVMPYVDTIHGASLVRRNGKNWVRLGSGPIDCSNTDGLGGTEDERSTCDHCGDRYDDDDYGGDGMCQYCYDQCHATCEDCNDSEHVDNLRTGDNGNRYCHSCWRDHINECKVCGDSFNDTDFDRADTREREMNGVEDCCADCADTHVWCSTCTEYVPKDTVVTEVPRAEFAGDGTNVDGIRPELDYAIATTERFNVHCSECKRIIRCPNTGDLILVIEQSIGADNLVAAGNELRASMQAVGAFLNDCADAIGEMESDTTFDVPTAVQAVPLPVYRRSTVGRGQDYMRLGYAGIHARPFIFPFVEYVQFPADGNASHVPNAYFVSVDLRNRVRGVSIDA